MDSSLNYFICFYTRTSAFQYSKHYNPKKNIIPRRYEFRNRLLCVVKRDYQKYLKAKFLDFIIEIMFLFWFLYTSIEHSYHHTCPLFPFLLFWQSKKKKDLKYRALGSHQLPIRHMRVQLELKIIVSIGNTQKINWNNLYWNE